MIRLEAFIGTSRAIREHGIATLQAWSDNYARIVSLEAGGCSIIPGRGFWIDGNGNLAEDSIQQWIVFVEDSDQEYSIRNYLEYFGRLLGEEKILVVRSIVDG